jgi:hypothetical protein
VKIRFAAVALITALMITLSTGAIAAEKSAAKAKTQTTTGTIGSISGNELVVTQKVKVKEYQVTFMLDPSTQKSGNLAAGTNVTVKYRVDNNQKMATELRERATKTASTKPGKKS